MHVYTVLWLIGDLRALVLRPIRIEEGKLLLRIGLRWEADVPLEAIAAVERTPGANGLRLGVLGTANLVLKLRAPMRLHGPFGIRKTSDTLLLQVDDPDGLARALGEDRNLTTPGYSSSSSSAGRCASSSAITRNLARPRASPAGGRARGSGS